MNITVKVGPLRSKMKCDPIPSEPRLYNFFRGMPEVLTEQQINEVRRILKEEYDSNLEFLNNSRPRQIAVNE